MSTSTAPVDVVMPLYNGERFVERTLRSVLGQSVPPKRLIVVDDGSTDGGVQRVKDLFAQYKGPTEVILLQQANKGPNAARNMGIRHGDSPYLAFVDADDVWNPTKLDRQLHIFERSNDPGLLLVYCHAHWIDEAGDPAKGPPLKEPQPLRGRVFDVLLPRNRITGSASAVLVRRTALDRAGTFDESLRTMEDFDMWLRIAEKGTIDLVEEDLVALRTHPDNNTKKAQHMLEGLLRFIAKWFARGEKRPDVMHEWGHLVALLVARAEDRARAYATVAKALSREQRRILFRRAGGSLRLYVLLKRSLGRIKAS